MVIENTEEVKNMYIKLSVDLHLVHVYKEVLQQLMSILL
jgi:hypothetical protein